jgi:hypothetical protein
MNLCSHRMSGKRQSGAFMPFIMLTIIPFTLVIGMVFNTGAMIIRKEKIQNAADAASLSQATLTSRSLNLIAMNNTAITQVFAIHILGQAAIIPFLEMTKGEVKEGVEILSRLAQGLTFIAPCATPPFVGCVSLVGIGVETGLRTAHHIINIFNPLNVIRDDLGGFTFTKVREFGKLSKALGEMNQRINTEFPSSALKMQQQIAGVNGLAYFPRIIAAYTDVRKLKANQRYITTDLPIETVNIEDPASLVKGMLPIKLTGELGSNATPKQRANFKAHGYKNGKGPYAIAKPIAKREIKKIKDALNKKYPAFPAPPPSSGGILWPDEKIKSNYSSLLDASWNAQTITQATLLPPATIKVHVLRKDFLGAFGNLLGVEKVFYDGDKLSIFSVVADRAARGPVFQSRFNNTPGVVYAYSQAEIYNPVYPDAYTQDWHAKLRRSSMLEKSKFRDKIQAGIAHKRQDDAWGNGVSIYDPLKRVLTSLSSNTLEAMNVQ